jgi:type I restriction enzyme S subunit
MKITTIKQNWLKESGQRFDASYHLSDGVKTKRIIDKFCPYPTVSLIEESDSLFKGNIHKRVYVESEENGYMFFTASDLFKNSLETGKYISRRYSPYLKELELKKDWILITRSGTLGKVVFINSDFEGKIGTDDLVRIKPKEEHIKKGFLYAYLSSNYGYGLLTQSGYGGVVKHIEPHHIANLKIPIFPKEQQNAIDSLIKKSSELRVKANSDLQNAIGYFEELIGQSNINLGFQFNTVSARSINGFYKRFDAQYQLLNKALKNEEKSDIPYSKISDYAESIFVGGRGKRNYVENGVPFLSSSDMMQYNPKRNCKNVSRMTSGLSLMTVAKKDILISRSGTVGNTVLVGKDLNNTAISEHALRLVINQNLISPNYVFCFLKTKYGIRSLESSSFGSVIITLNEDLIGNINMPLLPKLNQMKITDSIENYLNNMDESVALENQAIDMVEKEIEEWEK